MADTVTCHACAGMPSVEAAGLRLAVMMTLVRLLEVKLVELEGPEGTGLLEEDVRLLEGPLSISGKLHRTAVFLNERHACDVSSAPKLFSQVLENWLSTAELLLLRAAFGTSSCHTRHFLFSMGAR